MNSKRRDALLGACVCALLVAAMLYLNLAHPERQARHSYTLKACFEDLSRCRSQPFVRLEGAYAPGSLLEATPDCGAEFDLQSPGGDPPGKVHVCAERRAPELESNCAARVSAEGHFDGTRFLAERARATNVPPCPGAAAH